MSADDEGRSSSWDVDRRRRKWPGVAALALFAVLAWVFATASFGDPASGFSGEAGITASIGYAMFNIDAPNAVPSEGFLVAFILIAVVLDAALDGAVMLASREEDGVITTALRSEAADTDESERVAADGGDREGRNPSGTGADGNEGRDANRPEGREPGGED